MGKHADATYFMRRATQSRTAASNATCREASYVHRDLAAAYEDRARKAVGLSVPRDTPCEVEAVNGEVQVTGLDERMVSFTPNAAQMTADSLLRAAIQAGNQIVAVGAQSELSEAGRDHAASSEHTEANADASRGHVVLTPGGGDRYKVILEHEGGKETEQSVPTVQAGEALIKQATPAPPKRDAMFDRSASDG